MASQEIVEKKISKVEEFIQIVKSDYEAWGTSSFPWFRGEPESDTPLLPKLFRKEHHENQLLQFFRMKAPILGLGYVPPRAEHTDQWLFLAQHVGLPTRLLDWTEGALVALYFALQKDHPVVWMLDPVQLNRLSLPTDQILADNQFPLTWDYRRPLGTFNIGTENIRCAWEKKNRGVDLPVAVHPTNIHPRMSAQKSCFTVHGKREECLNNLLPLGYRFLRKYCISSASSESMLKDLRILGISHSTLFPDLDGLTKELGEIF
jgi:hypothetical protein